MQPAGPTNLREVVAYFSAQGVRIAIIFALAAPVLGPFYRSLSIVGGALLVTAAALGVGAIAMLIAYPLFLWLRGLFGGVPAFVGPGKERAFTTSGPEIAAYAVIVLAALTLSQVVSMFLLQELYRSLLSGGQRVLITPISLGVSVIEHLICFVIFVLLRRALSGLPRAG